jgi:hypothetical protein
VHFVDRIQHDRSQSTRATDGDSTVWNFYWLMSIRHKVRLDYGVSSLRMFVSCRMNGTCVVQRLAELLM